jgi:hypothetical protein
MIFSTATHGEAPTDGCCHGNTVVVCKNSEKPIRHHHPPVDFREDTSVNYQTYAEAVNTRIHRHPHGFSSQLSSSGQYERNIG